MAIHRTMATAFEKPSLHVILDTRSRFAARSKERVLNAISGAVPVATKQFCGVRNQRAFVARKKGAKPFVIGGWASWRFVHAAPVDRKRAIGIE